MQKDQAAECTERSSCTRRTDQLGAVALSFSISSFLGRQWFSFSQTQDISTYAFCCMNGSIRVIVSRFWQIISGCFCFSQTQDIPTLSLHYVFDLRIYTYLRILMHYLAFSLQIKILHYLTAMVLRYSHDAHFFSRG